MPAELETSRIRHTAVSRRVALCAAALAAFWSACGLAGAAPADPEAAASTASGVVINEILYNAPNDLDDLEYVELHNSGNTAADLSGWVFVEGIRYTFPAGTELAPGGYLLLCRDLPLFEKHYGRDVAVAGQFSGALGNRTERLTLLDGDRNKVDTVEYADRSPWPVSADGYGSSLERISPAANGDAAASWAPSPLPLAERKPGGTPGRRNAAHAERLPPVIDRVAISYSQVEMRLTMIGARLGNELSSARREES